MDRAIRSDSATDRDGNGQMPSDGQQPEHGPMSDEQLQKALDHLQSLPVVKDHNLTLEVVMVEQKRFVLLKESDGKLIRRIPESELWTLQVVRENEKGQLLRKTA